MQSLAEIPIGRLQLQEATVYVNTKQPNTRNIYLTKYHDSHGTTLHFMVIQISQEVKAVS